MAAALLRSLVGEAWVAAAEAAALLSAELLVAQWVESALAAVAAAAAAAAAAACRRLATPEQAVPRLPLLMPGALALCQVAAANNCRKRSTCDFKVSADREACR